MLVEGDLASDGEASSSYDGGSDDEDDEDDDDSGSLVESEESDVDSDDEEDVDLSVGNICVNDDAHLRKIDDRSPKRSTTKIFI